MPLLRHLSLSLLILTSSLAFAQKHTSVYVIAHPDDWQLFMGNDAFNDIQDTNTKVVFIMTTSGDGTFNKPAPNLRYARSRERGMLNSIRFCADMKTIVDSNCNTRRATFNGHRLLSYPYKHAKAYFLRLPDGCFSAGYHGQSLEYLHDGKINSLEAIDTNETYESWNDVVQTIRAIISAEARDKNDISINYQDPDRIYNKGDHPDHRFTGIAAIQAAAAFPMARHRGYKDYQIVNEAVNLNPEEIAIKASIFAVANFALTEDGNASGFNGSHLTFLTRTYSRELPVADTSEHPYLPLDIQVMPNPASAEVVRVAYNMNINAKTSLLLHDLQGHILWLDSEIQTVPGANTSFIPLSGIPAGTYFITLITPDAKAQVKFVRM